MRIQDLFVKSNEHLGRVVDQVGSEQWSLALPEKASWNPQNLTRAVAYHAFDDAWVPDSLAGRTEAEVGDRYTSVLDTPEPRSVYRQYNVRAREAVAAFTTLDTVTHLSYGEFSAREYLQHITSFRTIRTFDIARLIGVDPQFDTEFLEGVESEYSPLMSQYREMGVFPDPIPVDAGATLETRVMAMFGRD